MWLLSLLNEQQHETNKRYLLRPGKEYTIGRKGSFRKMAGSRIVANFKDILTDASIVFLDKSVSRKHAVIKVDSLSTRSVFKDTRPKLLLSDQNSKYGTFINEKPLEHALYLNDRDIIRFGSMNSIVKLRWVPVVVCLSSMRMADKTSIAERAAQLGILLKREWDEHCTHLYMKEIDDTAKFFLCLIHARPIISEKWFDAILSIPEEDFTWPNGDYLPVIKRGYDIQPEECEPNPRRSTLFNDLDFLFFDAQLYQIYDPIVKAASGRTNLLPLKTSYSPDDLTSENKIVVAPAFENNASFRKIVDLLQKRNRKWVEGQDIGTAIVKCTTEGLWAQARVHSDDNISVSFPGIETQRQQPQSLSPIPAGDPPSPVESPSARADRNTLESIFDNILGDDDDDDNAPHGETERGQPATPSAPVEVEFDFDSINEPSRHSIPANLSGQPNPQPERSTEAVSDAALHSSEDAADEDNMHVRIAAEADRPVSVESATEENASGSVQVDDAVEDKQQAGRTPRMTIITESLVKRTEPPLSEMDCGRGVNTKRFKKGILAENSQTNLHLVVMHDDGDFGSNADRKLHNNRQKVLSEVKGPPSFIFSREIAEPSG
ncbi:hypothetical protein BX666DRAFT_2134438, partial [Dichotomocladium elegans]